VKVGSLRILKHKFSGVLCESRAQDSVRLIAHTLLCLHPLGGARARCCRRKMRAWRHDDEWLACTQCKIVWGFSYRSGDWAFARNRRGWLWTIPPCPSCHDTNFVVVWPPDIAPSGPDAVRYAPYVPDGAVPRMPRSDTTNPGGPRRRWPWCCCKRHRG